MRSTPSTVNAASTLDSRPTPGHLWRDPGVAAGGSPGHLSLLEEEFPGARANVGGFGPSAWTPLLWNAAGVVSGVRHGQAATARWRLILSKTSPERNHGLIFTSRLAVSVRNWLRLMREDWQTG